MKATELMIGDYIMLYEDIYIIEEISSKGWAHIIRNDGSNCRVALSTDYILGELTPIPLTADILEKNGFVKQAYDGWLISVDNGRGQIEYRTDYFDGLLRINYNKKPFSKLMIKVKYVHELQHALRLCNIEKDIEI